MSATCPVHLILLEFIILIYCEEYSLWSWSLWCPSSLLLLHPSGVHIFFWPFCSQTPSVYILPLMSETTFHIHTKLWQSYNFVYFNL
jgi:hypothetical protein